MVTIWVTLFVYAVFFLTANFKNSEDKLGYVILYLVMPMLGIVYFYERAIHNQLISLFIKFKNIIVALSIMSLFFWVFASLGASPNMSINVNWGSNSTISGYYGLHFIAQGATNFLGLHLIRNTGLFVEAPMYSYVLSIALLVVIFLEKKSKYTNLEEWLLVITIFTTTSSTGAILVVLSFTFYLLYVNKLGNWLVKSILVLLGLAFSAFAVRFIISEKLSANWWSSSSLRIDDYIAGFQAWQQHPFLGNGLGNYDEILNFMDTRRLLAVNQLSGITGFSNGIMEVLAYGGVVGLLLYLIPTIFGLFTNRKVASFAMLSFFLFCVTVINNSYIYIFILTYLLVAFILRKDELHNHQIIGNKKI
ncbi:O-antigen ligase family protein [Secundilactobacillus sp. HBUAS58055]|nr:O-antigen ligase family protein [Secundilactobacillus angelensis]